MRCASCGHTVCKVPGCRASEAALARLMARWTPITSKWLDEAEARAKQGKRK